MYQAGKPYTALYVISGGSQGYQGIYFEGTLTKSSDKVKVRLIYQLMNKLTLKIKSSGLEPKKGNQWVRILHKFGGTLNVPNWDSLVIFWVIETIVKKAEDRGEPFRLNNLDPFSNLEHLQAFFKRVGGIMENGGYPSWKAETNEALANWEDVLDLEVGQGALPPSPPIPSSGGGVQENSDSEGSSILSLFVPVKVKVEKDGKLKKSVRFTAYKPSATAIGSPFPAKRSLRIENGGRAVNVKIKRKWFNVKINDAKGQQAWEDGKKVKVSLEDVRKIEKE